ncbi:lytic transglycosylase domain-containing protein [Streptomyces sp. RB6PN25]|uniref:Lytic transglycosylase domain-containing protein n=1 Tax=Streptomyces humicola TaxID=2953240 RepID=A0ABT1PUV5_9ACTN|nr:lytic transglycosylase domain-containing protein [Streptomyces humicola]MCQ4081456.1 lytic transglycosylase domain-containing protein [Streptomyces humicola]
MAVRIGRRLRKGVAGTAVAAAAMAALSASQAPGLVGRPLAVKPPPGRPIDGGSPFNTRLPPANPPSAPGGPGAQHGGGQGQGTVVGGAGIPATVLAAYQKAEAALRGTRPQCHLQWQLLAAIGQVESGQADGGNVDAKGTTLSPILGPVLDGSHGYAKIPATPVPYGDGGSAYARAVGPMQFIPSTWAVWGADGNGDGIKDPNNVFDAALAAGGYLCAAGGDLSVADNVDSAILGYNDSQQYLKTVLAWYRYFLGGAPVVPDGSGAGAPEAAGATPTAGPSPSASAPAGGRSGSGRPSQSPQPTASASGSIGPLPGGSPSGSPSQPSPSASSPSPSGSGSPSPSPSPTCPVSPSPSPSGSTSPSPTPSPSPSGSPSPSPCGSTTSPSPSPSASGSPGPSASPSPSATG